jgi:hypothetical protein
MLYIIFAITDILKGWILFSQGLSPSQTSSQNLIFIPLQISKEFCAKKSSLTFIKKNQNTTTEQAGVDDYIRRGA